jgi:CRP-like cAMP-binding protein
VLSQGDTPSAPGAAGLPRPRAGRRFADDARPPHNRLLAALPDDTSARLRPKLERVRLASGQVVCQPHRPIEHAYFPIDAVVSLYASLGGAARVQVASVGNEGFVGLPVFLGAEAASGWAIAQIGGDAWRIPVAAFTARAHRDPPLRALLEHYVQVYTEQVCQTAGCDRAHSLEERCARSLLTTHDRTWGDRFVLTQEDLASVIGVRRATVSALMSTLRQAGAVTYSRGVVSVVDRAVLEAAACACYRILADGYDRLIGQPFLPSPRR